MENLTPQILIASFMATLFLFWMFRLFILSKEIRELKAITDISKKVGDDVFNIDVLKESIEELKNLKVKYQNERKEQILALFDVGLIVLKKRNDKSNSKEFKKET